MVQKGGVNMGLFKSVMEAIMAGIVVHYVCKWLDGYKDKW